MCESLFVLSSPYFSLNPKITFYWGKGENCVLGGNYNKKIISEAAHGGLLGQEQLGKVGGGLLVYGMYVGYPGREALIPKTF